MYKTTLLTILFILSGWTADGAEIRLRDKADCSGPIVRLGDVAEVFAVDALTTHRLIALNLFPTPANGRQRTLARQEVQELLALSDISLKDYRFTGAESVAVRAKVVVAETPKAVRLPAIAKAAPAAQGTSETGPVQLAVYTVRPLRQGTVVQAADVQLQPAVSGAANPALASSLDEIVGKELTRSLSAGQSIQRDLVQMPRLVMRGDEVTIQAIAAGVTITTSGRAAESGGKGDVIQIEMPDSRERIFGRIVNYRTVAVYANTPTFAGAQTQTK